MRGWSWNAQRNRTEPATTVTKTTEETGENTVTETVTETVSETARKLCGKIRWQNKVMCVSKCSCNFRDSFRDSFRDKCCYNFRGGFGCGVCGNRSVFLLHSPFSLTIINCGTATNNVDGDICLILFLVFTTRTDLQPFLTRCDQCFSSQCNPQARKVCARIKPGKSTTKRYACCGPFSMVLSAFGRLYFGSLDLSCVATMPSHVKMSCLAFSFC